MKAIFDGKLYTVVDTVRDKVILEPAAGDKVDGDDRIEVYLGDMRLNVDPTDDEVNDVSQIKMYTLLPSYECNADR